jgi:hypothetical protein
MPRKPTELPPRVAKAFVRDLRAFFKAKNQLKQDEIASRQLHALFGLSATAGQKAEVMGCDDTQQTLRWPSSDSARAVHAFRERAVISDGRE